MNIPLTPHRYALWVTDGPVRPRPHSPSATRHASNAATKVTGVKINVEDTGDVTIASSDEASAQKAIDMIKRLTEEVEVGKIYLGTVRKIMDFGAFVEVLPGTDGLVHISQLAHHRVKAVTDEVSEGDQVMVKVLEIDKQGKIRLSRKEAMPAPAGSPATEPTPAG